MKRPTVIIVGILLLLALPTAASAQLPARAGLLHSRNQAQSTQSALRTWGSARTAQYVPLARTLTGTGTLRFNVYQPNSLAEVGADVYWDVMSDAGSAGGHGMTDADGKVTLTGVPGASSNGEVDILSNTGTYAYTLSGLSWPEADNAAAGVQSGTMPLTITPSDDPYYNGWTDVYVALRVAAGNGTFEADTEIPRTAPPTGDAMTMNAFGPSTLTDGTLKFREDEGLELNVYGLPVSPGEQTTYPATVDEASAQRIWTSGWGSGKPGSRFSLVFDDFAAGWQNSVVAIADWPTTAPLRNLGHWTSATLESQGKSITVPKTTLPGYAYRLFVSHETGPLQLSTWFQTCSLKASSATVHHGGAIKLSGVVPVAYHQGKQKGSPKTVTIYATKTSTSSQPTKAGGFRSSGGWTKVGTARANGLGVFTTKALRPSRTTRYVVWYPRDKWYWAAYTSVIKVTVK